MSAIVDEFAAAGVAGAAEMPTGLVKDPAQFDLAARIFHVLRLPGVVLRRKLRLLAEAVDPRRCTAVMLPQNLANVGLDDAAPIVSMLDEAGLRKVAAYAPEIFATKGTGAGLRLGASMGAGRRPVGIFDWFSFRWALDVTPLPLIAIDEPAGQYATDIHVADRDGVIDRDVLEELVQMHLGMSEIATVYYVWAFEDGSTGPWQWNDSGGLLSVPDPDAPHLRRASTGASTRGPYLEVTDPTAWANYVARFALSVPTDHTEYLWVYAQPWGAGYYLKIVVSGGSATLSLHDYAGAAVGGSAVVTWVTDVVYLVSVEIQTSAGGNDFQVLVDGDLILAVVDPAPVASAYGTIATAGNGVADIYMAEVFEPSPDSALVEHDSVRK